MTEVMKKEKTLEEYFKMHKVLMHNDDFTPIEVVDTVLSEVFHKSLEERVVLIATAEIEQVAIVGDYTLDIAKSLIYLAQTFVSTSYAEHFPLRFSIQNNI